MCLGNYDSAEEFKNLRRNVEPAVYYAERLAEQPIPNIQLAVSPASNASADNVENFDVFDGSDEPCVDEEETDVVGINELSLGSTEPSSNSVENSEQNLTNDVSIDINTSNIQHELSAGEDSDGPLPIEAIFIDEFPLIKDDPSEIIPDDILDNLISENATVVIDEDISMTIGFNGVPKPFAANSEEMIKREDDPISGNIPFNLTVG